MKKLFAVVVFGLSMSLPSFGAEHVLSHSAKFVGRESAKAATVSAAKVDHAGKAVVKKLF
jgi:hypothetical protein